MSSEKKGDRLRAAEEFRGKTVEAAINAGLAALRLARDEVEVEIVRPGSRGVLGIGAEDAIVRLTALRATGPEPQLGARDMETGFPRPGVEISPVPAGEAMEAKPEQPSVSLAAGEDQQPVPPAAPELSRSGRPQPSKGESGRAGTARKAGGARAAGRQGKAPAEGPVDRTKGTPERSRTSPEVESNAALAGQQFLTGLLERMNVHATVEVVSRSPAEAGEDEAVQVLNIVGDNLGILIGRQNEVLAALELITRLTVNQQSHVHSHFAVDVNGYRAKRADSLRKLAVRMAEQAVETGRTVVLEPMPPSERRIIHLTLRDDPQVTTLSVGEGDHRKVTIVPKRD